MRNFHSNSTRKNTKILFLKDFQKSVYHPKKKRNLTARFYLNN